MSIKAILIVAGEPYSIFSEILFKSLIKINSRRPIVLIASKKLLIKFLALFSLLENKFKVTDCFSLSIFVTCLLAIEPVPIIRIFFFIKFNVQFLNSIEIKNHSVNRKMLDLFNVNILYVLISSHY